MMQSSGSARSRDTDTSAIVRWAAHFMRKSGASAAGLGGVYRVHLRRAGFCICLLFWFALFATTGLFSAGFQLIDDHTLLEVATDLAGRDAHLPDVVRKWVAMDFGERRFRPLYYASRVVRTELFGLSWPAWSVYNALMAASASAGLYLFATAIGFTTLSSLLLAALSVLGRPSTIWWRLGTPETEGNLLLVLSLLFAAGAVLRAERRAVYEIAAVVAAVLASLTKEGMILFLPAVAAMRVWLPCWIRGSSLKAAWNESRTFTRVLVLLAGLELLAVLLTVGTGGTGYGGVDAESFDSRRLWAGLRAVDSVAPFWIPFAGTTAAVLIAARRSGNQKASLVPLVFGWLAFLVAAIPQILLYAKSGWADHYFNPIIISCILLMLITAEHLRRIRVGLYLLVAVLLLFEVNPRFRWTRQHARDFAASGVALSQLLRAAADCSLDGGPVLVVANPRAHYEEAFSLRTYLMAACSKPQVYLATVGASGAHIFSGGLSSEERARAFLEPRTLEDHYFEGHGLPRLTAQQRDRLDAILVLSPERLERDFLSAAADWLRTDRYHRTDFELLSVRVRLFCRKR